MAVEPPARMASGAGADMAVLPGKAIPYPSDHDNILVFI
jgi:hypothetical protein